MPPDGSGRLRGWQLLRRLAAFLVRTGARHPRLSLILAAVATVAAALALHGVEIETDVLSLVPTRNREVQAFRETLERFGSTDLLVGVVDLGADRESAAGSDSSPEDALPERLDFVAELGERLRASPRLSWIEYSSEGLIELALDLLDAAPLLMSEDSLDDFLARLSGPGLETQIGILQSRARTPTRLLGSEILRQDPLDMLSLVGRGTRVDGFATAFDSQSGFLLDGSRRYALIIGKPVRPAVDLPFSRALVAELREVERAARAAWVSAGAGDEAMAPPVTWTGGHVIGVEDTDMVVVDMLRGAVIAFVGVVAVFFYAFGRLRAMWIAAVPLAVGLVVSFGLAALLLGRLNSLTMAGAALLIGLGIDFVIVLYARYLEVRREGGDHDDALGALADRASVSVLVGAVTTAATFFAFLVSEFAGLAELGLLTGLGILVLVVSVFVLLPALVTLIDKDRAAAGRRHHLRGLGLEPLVGIGLRRPTRVLALAAVALLPLLALASRLEYDEDINKLRAHNIPSVGAQELVNRVFGLRLTPLTVRVDGNDDDDALSRARSVARRLRALDVPELARIETVAERLPLHREQEHTLERLRAEAPPAEEVLAALRAELERRGLRPAAFDPGLATLRRALERDRPLDLRRGPAGHFVEHFLASGEGWSSVAIYAFPTDRLEEVPAALLAAVEDEPGVLLTGPRIASDALKRIVLRDALIAALLGMAAVLIILWVDLGRLRLAVLACLPLALGLAVMAGTMALLGVNTNFGNLFVFTMVIGIGVDYGVHLTHRWLQDGFERLEGTATAVSIAALTTLVGFGSLAISQVPAIRSMGVAAILGASGTALVSLLVLPAALSRFGARSTHPKE